MIFDRIEVLKEAAKNEKTQIGVEREEEENKFNLKTIGDACFNFPVEIFAGLEDTNHNCNPAM